jgi:5-methylcytosine-specific restriction endonuclease McrA
MPISSENKKLYPLDWLEIRKSILDRAQHRCEYCSISNYSVGYRQSDGKFISCESQEVPENYKCIKIILTIAHVDDPNPENCASENLRALCQKCHNNHDAKMRSLHASATRNKRKRESGSDG